MKNRTLSELYELRELLAGTNYFFIFDKEFKKITDSSYRKMIFHNRRRDKLRSRKFKR